MKTRIIVVLLLILSLTPILIEMIKFDLHWSLQWSNESRVWAAIFSLLAFVAVVISYKNRRKSSKLFAISLLLFMIILIPPAHDIVKLGVGASSKGDSENLDLIGYWKNL